MAQALLSNETKCDISVTAMGIKRKKGERDSRSCYYCSVAVEHKQDVICSRCNEDVEVPTSC